MTPLDIILYSWSFLGLVILSVAFPPLLLAVLLFPLWHRKRRAKRALNGGTA